jgi:O-antigen/teichoic acid export membrane protein
MSNAQRVTRNILAVLGSELLARLVGLVLTLYVARGLGVDRLGQLAFLISFMTLASVLADLGISRMLTRNLARDRQAAVALAPAAFRAKLGLVLAMAALLALLSPFLGKGPELARFFLVFIGWLVLDGLNATLRALFAAREELATVALLRAVEKLLLLALFGLLFALPLGERRFLGLLILFPAASGGAFLLALVLAHRRGIRLFTGGGPGWRRILAMSWPFAGSVIMANITLHSDRVLLSYMKDDAATGLYDAANRIFFTLFALQAMMADVFFPTLTRLFAGDRARYTRFAERAARLLFGLALPMAAGTLLLAAPGLHLIYGEAFAGAATSLRLLAPALVLRAGHALWGSLLLAGDRERHFLAALGAGAGLNVLLNLALIPRWSLDGAALATLLSEVLVLALMVVWARPLAHLPWRLPFLRALGAAAGMGLLLALLPTHNLALALPAGLAVYGLLFTLVRGWRREDLQLLRRAEAKES